MRLHFCCAYEFNEAVCIRKQKVAYLRPSPFSVLQLHELLIRPKLV